MKNNHQKLTVSVIVTTYNWPAALRLVIDSLLLQSHMPNQIIIADDGSTAETKQQIERYGEQVTHVWQEDQGFRAASVRNLAIAKATSDYLIFIDGDCVVFNNFIARHLSLAEAGYFVYGNRILLNQEFTQQVINRDHKIYRYNIVQWLKLWQKRYINHFLPLIDLPLAKLRKIFPKRWKGVKTCNFAAFRQDLLMVKGFDEQYQGWGFEDSDCVIRLHNAGIRTKVGKFALPVLHLWHHEHNRDNQQQNWQRLQKLINSKRVHAEKGLS